MKQLSQADGTAVPTVEFAGKLERMAAGVTRWSERWFPDAYIFAAIAVVVVAIGALAIGAPVQRVGIAFGDGFWSLIPFTMQMAVVAISGYVVAVSPPASRVIAWLARLPSGGRSAVAFVALVSILASLFNWAISLIFSGLLVRALAQRKDLRLDYRAAGAAAYLGMGATWALGLSSSASQLQANPESLPKALLAITGVIPFSETIFLPQSMLMVAVLTVASLLIAYLSAPTGSRAKTAAELGVVLDDGDLLLKKPTRPGDAFMSPVLQSPLALGADIAMHSTTKFLNGHSDGLGGALIGSKPEHKERFLLVQKAAGGILSPFECFLVLRGIKTLPLRMKAHEENGRAVAEFLSTQTKMTRLAYPGLKTHAQHELAVRQQKGFGSMMSFDLGSSAAAGRFLGAIKLFLNAESLGGVESLASHSASTTHFALSFEEKQALGITEGLVRLSVGIEDKEDLIADLDQALAAV